MKSAAAPNLMIQLLRRLIPGMAVASLPVNLRHGMIGEKAARKFLQKLGLKFLVANFRSDRGEIDLVFKDEDCLVFVEVKARASEDWERPADAVDDERKWRLSRTALDYLRQIRNPEIKVRFDIVEVLLDGEEVAEVRHLPNSFPMSHPYSYR